MSNAPIPKCNAWTYYANPAPAWATARAVALLQAGNAQPNPRALVGTVASVEWGQDGKLVQYSYAWHPPDAQNPTPGGHLGVEVKYCSQLAGSSTTLGTWALEGVDVSDAQGTIDWEQVFASGRAFAWVKATEGLPGAFRTPQATFAANWKGAPAAGIVVGPYHYFRPSLDAAAQAQHHAAVVGKLGLGDMPCALDCEHADDVEPAAAYDPSTYGPGVITYLRTIAQLTGRRPIVYASRDTWGELVTPADAETIAQLADFWMAAWPSSTPPPGTQPPGTSGAWPSPLFWQYQSGDDVVGGNGRCPGISTGVDLDRFSGTLADLARYVAGRSPSPPAPPAAPGGSGGVGLFRFARRASLPVATLLALRGRRS